MKDARTIARDYIALLKRRGRFTLWTTGYEQAANSTENWSEQNGNVLVERRGTNETLKIFVPIAVRIDDDGMRANHGLYWNGQNWIPLKEGFSSLASKLTDWTYSPSWSYALIEATI